MVKEKGLASAYFIEEIRKSYTALIVPKKVPPSYWGRVTKVLKDSGITRDDAFVLGQWLSRQAWLTDGITVMVAAQKAGEWLARAQAEKSKSSKKQTRIEWVDLSDIEE